MRQDPAFKDIFAYGFMVEELMRWFVGDLHGGRELVDALDFSLLLRVQEQSTTGRAGDKRSYANDIVWRVPFRGRPADGGDRAWLHLVLMIEVQGEVDHLMALRVRNYVDNHHLELWRGRRFGGGGPLGAGAADRNLHGAVALDGGAVGDRPGDARRVGRRGSGRVVPGEPPVLRRRLPHG